MADRHTVLPEIFLKENRLCRKGELSAACHIGLPCPTVSGQQAQPNNCQRLVENVCSTSIINRKKWLRDIINNSRQLMSSSLQPSLRILVYTIQEIDSLAIKSVTTACQAG